MKFDNEFRTKLSDNLKVNKDFFELKCQELFYNVSDTSLRLLLDNLCQNSVPFHLDCKIAFKYIRETLEDKEIGLLRNRTHLNNKFWDNEIKFNVKCGKDPEWNSPDQIKYRIARKELEYECEEEYWTKERKVEYQEISNFNCFIDKEFNNSDLDNVNSSRWIRNVDEWQVYVFNLVTKHFPDYTFTKDKSSKTYRFLKALNDDVFFGFEYDSSVLKNEVKRDDFSLPDYFNLILVNKNLKKSINFKSYIFEQNEDILSLGILGNPFCYPPCFPVLSYCAVDLFYKKENPENYTDYNYERTYYKHTENTFKVVHPIQYSDNIKKHAFFYMYSLCYSTKPYIDYIEKSIRESF